MDESVAVTTNDEKVEFVMSRGWVFDTDTLLWQDPTNKNNWRDLNSAHWEEKLRRS